MRGGCGVVMRAVARATPPPVENKICNTYYRWSGMGRGPATGTDPGIPHPDMGSRLHGQGSEDDRSDGLGEPASATVRCAGGHLHASTTTRSTVASARLLIMGTSRGHGHHGPVPYGMWWRWSRSIIVRAGTPASSVAHATGAYGDPPPGTGAFLAPRNGAKGIDEQTVSNGTASDAIVKLPRAGEATAVGYVHVADETTGKGIAPGTHDIQFCLGIGDDPGTRPSVRVDRDPGVWQG